MTQIPPSAQTINPAKGLCIKLGTAGSWEKESINSGILRFGYRETPFEAAVSGDWEAVSKVWLANRMARDHRGNTRHRCTLANRPADLASKRRLEEYSLHSFKSVHHLLWTAEVFRFVNRKFNSERFLEGHHRFNRVEAVHPVEAHGEILAPDRHYQAMSQSCAFCPLFQF